MLNSFNQNLKKLLGIAIIFSSSNINAEILPMTDEVQVHSESVGSQTSPIVATNTLGEHIIAYNEKVNNSYNSYLKFYDQNGNLVKTNQLSNGNTKLEIDDIAINNNGVSVAVFTLDKNAYLQVFERSGAPRFSGLIRLNSINNLSYAGIGVDINDNNEAVVHWMGYQFGESNLYLRQLNVNGYWMSNSLLVNSPKPYTSDVGIDAAGDFVVTWASSAVSPRKVYTQHYYSGGSVKRSTRTVYSATDKGQGYPQVDVNQATGEHVITWTDLSNANDYHIYARKFNANGTGAGTAFKVSQTPSLWEPTQSVQFSDNGIWVSWHTLSSTSDDVFAASFYTDGSVRSTEKQLNTFTAGQQRQPYIGLLPNDEFLVAWMSYLQDGDSWGLYQRRFID